MNVSATQKSPGRNDPCPCGSGKKYKKCCAGKVDAARVNHNQMLLQARKQFEQGNAIEAANICQQVLESDPDNPGANNVFGLALYRLGHIQEARQHLEIAVAGDPDNALINNNLGHITEMLGDLAAARQYCERAIRLSPRLADAYNNLGNVLVNDSTTLDEALANYRQAAALAPENPRFLMNVASALHRANEMDQAEKLYLQVIEQAPDWNEPLKNLGALKFQRGGYAQAKVYLERALALDAHDTDARLSLSQVQKQSGDLKGAEKHLRELVKAQPGSSQPQLELASLYQNVGWLDKMEQACEKAAEIEPTNPKVFEAWANYEEGRHQLDRAEELLLKAESLGLSRHNLLRAKIARRQKQFEQALNELEKVDPDQLQDEDRYKYFYDKGYLLDKVGRYPEAWSAFSEAANRKKIYENIDFRLQDRKSYLEEFSRFFNLDRMSRLRELANKLPALDGARPLFIVGFPRSGTTLLEQILCSHPKISAGDELPYLREIGSVIVDRIKSIESSGKGNDSLIEDELFELLQHSRQFYIDQVRNLEVVDMSGDYFTDKMPLNLNSLPLIYILFPDSPVVHIVRNPMDCALSNYFSYFGTGNSHSLDINDCAAYFRLTIEDAERVTENFNELKYLKIRYEDLVADQEAVTRNVVDFVGVPWDDACLDYYKTRRVSRTISYEDVTKKIYTSSVSRYRNYEDFLEEPLKILKPVMERYGYL